MGLLPKDKDFLDTHDFNYEVHESNNETILVIKDYSLSSMFHIDKTNVLIRIQNGYPMAPLDMFWVFPHIKLKETDVYPACADTLDFKFSENTWQRFSRHYPWKPTYNLSTHLNVVKDVLVNGRG